MPGLEALIIDHGGQCCGLAASCRPRNKDSGPSARPPAASYGRQSRSSSIVGIRSLSSLTVQASFLLPENIDTFPAAVRRLDGKIHVPSLRQLLLLPLVRHMQNKFPWVSSSVSCMGEYPNAPEPDEHGQPLGNMNIRTARLASHGYDCMNVHQPFRKSGI